MDQDPYSTKWTPQNIACVMLIGTVCIIMLAIEAGIVTRSAPSDVSESRQLLNHMTDIIIGLTAGFFMGRTRNPWRRSISSDSDHPPLMKVQAPTGN